mgnify:CR=1 FL=1
MAPGLKIGIHGGREIAEKLRKGGKRYEQALAAGIYGLASEIVTDAKTRVPVDLGALKGSGYATLPEKRRGRYVAEVGFGGPAKDYAVPQHERTEYAHEVGGPKYLENAINAASAGAVRRVAEIATAAFDANASATKGAQPTTPDEGQRGGGSKGSG